MIRTFDVKIRKKYFDEIISGKKVFELCMDEKQNPGNIVVFHEWDGKRYTGRWVKCKITYVLRKVYGLMYGYCVLGIDVIASDLDSFSDLEEHDD